MSFASKSLLERERMMGENGIERNVSVSGNETMVHSKNCKCILPIHGCGVLFLWCKCLCLCQANIMMRNYNTITIWPQKRKKKRRGGTNDNLFSNSVVSNFLFVFCLPSSSSPCTLCSMCWISFFRVYVHIACKIFFPIW